MIDAHVHFWNYDRIKDAWITDEMKLLQRHFFPEDLQPVLHENNVDGVIAVQASQDENETRFLLSLTQANPLIKGVVGWVDLQNESVEERLNYFSQFPVIKGFRHIVQSEPEGFLQKKNFLSGVKTLENFRFTYDVLVYENQLKDAVEFMNKFSGQKFIIDHCGKPSIKSKRINEWKQLMREISQNEDVYCKLSGLITEAEWNKWDEKDLYPYLEIVFESFGTERLLFGSDWPVLLLSGSYKRWKNLLESYMKDLSSQEKQKVFSENAMKFYSLNP